MLRAALLILGGYLLKTWVDKKGGVQAAVESVTGKANTPVASTATPQQDSSAAASILERYLRPTSGPAESGQQPAYPVPSWFQYDWGIPPTSDTGGQVN
jgi:hypothetical protein